MSEHDGDKQTTGSLQTSSSQMEKHEVVCGDNARLKEEGATVDNMDPSRPFLYLEKFDQKKMDEWVKIKSVWAAKNVKNDIMTDPTPQGKAPELNYMHANPNCMNPYGCFALHEAAERFFVDMIKLLFRHGASANVRTVGNAGTEDLLPLHIAVENTCMHKYLEDNLSPTQYNEDYVYKLIHLLCLPEMKIFLDTTRLLAEKTDNLVDELWNYMKDGKLVQSAVLLLTAQKQFRKVKPEGFHVIVQRLCCAPQTREKGDTGEAQKQLEEKGARFNCSLQLVSIISLAGEVLDKYIQAHSEEQDPPHCRLLVLQTHCQRAALMTERFLTGNYISKNVPLLPLLHGYVDSTKAVTEMSSMHSVEEKVLVKFLEEIAGTREILGGNCSAVRKGALIGWDPTYTRRSFLPYWRSALGPRGPSQEAVEVKSIVESGQYWGSSMIPGYNRKIWLMDKIPQIQSRRRSRRYSSATALKMLVKVAGGTCA
ncbi:Os03g0774900 [Oryza sativa Japonica Group]|uniref:Os03g0774900 protein n=1 Tax=Oryza sativa subsp. japonica TaxID=39947 RepID=Q0DN48_ORYSJ|nr:Os03g0774900 [Oryza sativa Japonica Group]|eukprot:NP_001051426.2 Os03g0774900 [Oryza sativa Japonica Group]